MYGGLVKTGAMAESIEQGGAFCELEPQFVSCFRGPLGSH